MAIHIQNEDVVRLVRDFARRRNVGITEAMRLAIMEADKSPVNETETLLVRIQPILDEVRAKLAGQPKRTWEDEKAFMDEGWGEAD